MKNIIFLTVILGLVLCGATFAQKASDALNKDSFSHEKSMSGLARELPTQGFSSGGIFNHGEEVKTIFDSIGKITKKEFYKNGKLVGIGEYDPYYGKWEEYSYKDGKRNGPMKRYYKNGTVAGEFLYKDDKIVGEGKMFFENGKLERENIYYNEATDVDSKEYYRSGKLKSERQVRHTDEVGYKEYYPNGRLMIEKKGQNEVVYDEQGNLLKDGIIKILDENEKLDREISYKDGKRNGIAKWYSPAGTLIEEETYKDGRDEGLYRRYDEKGHLRVEYIFKNGKEFNRKEYDENGKLIFPRKWLFFK